MHERPRATLIVEISFQFLCSLFHIVWAGRAAALPPAASADEVYQAAFSEFRLISKLPPHLVLQPLGLLKTIGSTLAGLIIKRRIIDSGTIIDLRFH